MKLDRRAAQSLAGILVSLWLSGCMSIPSSPSLGLQRSLYPGLDELSPEEIEQALEEELALEPPISAGLAWLNEAAPGTHTWEQSPLSEYQRTGVLDAALEALRREPLAAVAILPTVPNVQDSAPGAQTIDALRSASARFQYDVALLLQTGTSEALGHNPFAIGYLGIITIPLFPGEDLGVAASAELCAVDVRSGIMLGCARGRATATDRFLFRSRVDASRRRLVEQTLAASIAAAADDLLSQISARLSP